MNQVIHLNCHYCLYCTYSTTRRFLQYPFPRDLVIDMKGCGIRKKSRYWIKHDLVETVLYTDLANGGTNDPFFATRNTPFFCLS